MALVVVDSLMHSYDGRKSWAIKDVNFKLEHTGITGLLGSNGAGKSTTMNIICGVLNQTGGCVLINGADTRKESGLAKSRLGFLPQSPPLYLDFTVHEYLYHCARLRLMGKHDARKAIDMVMQRVSISHFRDRLLKNLSGGYKQRVGIAQAIIHRPKLVVLDEPTVGLDPVQIVEMRELIKEIAKDHSVLISTHIMSEVDQMCDQIIMIEGGQVAYNGTLNDFRSIKQHNAILLKTRIEVDLELINQIEGVERVEKVESAQYRIFVQNLITVPELLATLVVTQQWGLIEMSYEKKSLDSVFINFKKS